MAIKRIRDRIRGFKPQAEVSYDEWQQIEENAAQAAAFEKTIIFQMLQDDLQKATDIVVQNRVLEVHEEHTITETLKKVFITPSKVQADELVGQIKYIKGILDQVTVWVTTKSNLEAEEAAGRIVIHREPPKDE
jgi:hypothetical protein